jgi:Cu-Zn family superoxide dismutase
MPNLNVRSNGRTRAVLHNSRVTLGDGENSLFANGGTALVIHAGPDDMESDPAGNAGDRIAAV